MKYIKSFRANNISDLEDTEIREQEYLHEYTEFDDAGHAMEAITYNPDGTIDHSYKYKYDTDGRVTDELLLEGDDEITEHRSMVYNTDGQLVTELVHYLDGSADKLHFTYDEQGRLLSRKSIDSEGETGNYVVNVYNGDHLVSETEYDIAGEIITQRKIIYDKESNITEEVFLTPEENYHVNYSYDDKGVASVRRRYNEEKQLMERNTYTYNAEGRLSETMEETSSGIEITYTVYDAEGNVILQEEKTEDGTLLSSIERTYDKSNRPLTTGVLSQRPTQMVPQHYRIRVEYE